MIARLFLLGIRHQAAVLFALVLITAMAAAGLPRLQISTSFDSLIPADDPGRSVYQEVMREFGSDNRTIVFVQDPELWTPAKLRSLDELQRALAALPDISRVDSLFSLRTVVGHRGQVDAVPLLAGIPGTLAEADAARLRALDNPLYRGNMFSADGSATALVLSVRDPGNRDSFNLDVYTGIETAMATADGQFATLFQVGPPRVSVELSRSLYQDLTLLGPLSGLVLVLAILFFMRSGLAALVPVVTSTMTIIWTFGLMGWLGIPLNILSAMIPSLIVVIGSTEDTHMVSAFFRGLAESAAKGVAPGRGARTDSLRYMARHMGLPLLLTVLTTALGFASNLFSNIGLIQDFAVASTFAMLANGAITMLVVPMLLRRFGGDSGRTAAAGGGGVSPRRGVVGLPQHLVRLFRISQDHFPMNTLAVTAALCVFFVWQASQLYVTNDPMSYFPDDRPLIQDTKQVHEELAGVKVFYISLDTGVEKAFLEPRNVRLLADIQAFMDKQGVYDNSLSLANFLAFVNREFRGEFADLAVPESRELVAQYLLFFHRTDLESYISHDYSHANIVVRHNINDSHTLNRYIQELSDAASYMAGPDIRTQVVGENLMVNRAAESLLVAQVEALGLLLVLIFVIMSVMFTSLKGGAIALVPSIIPIALMFGIMGLLGIPLNPGTAMVAVIAIGIAIDGTIHLLARYNELCRRTSDYAAAVHQAVEEEATPLIVSSLALALGFGILLFSNFTVVAQFGALAAATMLFSIVANLLITPIIMARVRLVGLYQILGLKCDPAVLERSPLFKGMSRYQQRKAVLISELDEFAAGSTVMAQGEVGRSMFLILDGEAEVARTDDGVRRVLATLKPGDVVGEIGYIRAVERTADVLALGPVSVLRFDYSRMQQDLKYFPNIVAKLNFNISAILGERLGDVLAQQGSKTSND